MIFKYLLLAGLIYIVYKFVSIPNDKSTLKENKGKQIHDNDDDFVEYEEIE